MHGRHAPRELERKAARKAQYHAANQATEQEGAPGGAEAVFEPVPGQMEFEMVRLEAQQRGAHPVGHVVGRDHRERIDQVGRRDRHGKIQSPIQRREYHQRQMDR
jgi:hypothetical protein